MFGIVGFCVVLVDGKSDWMVFIGVFYFCIVGL